jgi:hypothetical protein
LPVRKTTLTPDAIPTLPNFFDKERLYSGDFDKYIYTIPFKKTGKEVRGMSADGYINAIHPYLKGIRSEILHYGFANEKRAVLSCVVRVTVTVSYKPSEDSDPIEVSIEGLGDGDVQDVPTGGSLVRTVETRALNRALSRLLNVSKADLNNEFTGEDEYGTQAPVEFDDNHRKSPQEIKAEREKKYYPGDELDADQATERRDISDSEGEAKPGKKEPDW